MEESNKVIIISSPSGGGKSTIVRYLLSQRKDLSLSVSACTREIRKGEVNGEHYYFMSEEDFRKKIDQRLFLEWEEVYPGNFYGTLKSEVDRLWELDKVVLFDVDVKGAKNIKRYFEDNALSIFIKPPSFNVLKERLVKRNTETSEDLRKRLARVKYELTFEEVFDVVVINDDLETAQKEALEIVNKFLTSSEIKDFQD